MPNAPTVEEYLAALPADRRAAIASVRKVILENLPSGYEEGLHYGMIGYFVPHSIYPKGYHADPALPLTYASLGSQKHHMALYLMSVYGDPEMRAWFVGEYERSGKKLDMGKSCVRFTRLEELPLELVGRTIARVPVARFIAQYESVLAAAKSRPKSKPASKKKAPAK